jgi:hypothetical protein
MNLFLLVIFLSALLSYSLTSKPDDGSFIDKFISYFPNFIGYLCILCIIGSMASVIIVYNTLPISTITTKYELIPVNGVYFTITHGLVSIDNKIETITYHNIKESPSDSLYYQKDVDHLSSSWAFFDQDSVYNTIYIPKKYLNVSLSVPTVEKQ